MEEIDTPEARDRIESLFPNLPRIGYQITSPKDPRHNCIAYAVGDLQRKWQGREWASLAGYYWPPDAKKGTGIDELIYAYQALGFERCGMDKKYEMGFEKVAIYMSDSGKWSHAAKLNEDGTWSSKIGDYEDIRHASPHAFEGYGDYGSVYCIMKRRTLQFDAEREIEAFE